VIPEAAVEAAVIAYKHAAPYLSTRNALIEALEAAAPHLLSHEREETRLAHLDAVVNAEAVDRLEAKLDAVGALADEWEARGESDMAGSKQILDGHIAMALLTEGASLVENARHIRNAIGS